MAADRSGPDLTADALRALHLWQAPLTASDEIAAADRQSLTDAISAAIEQGVRFLQYVQRPEGSWDPLWYGNQYQPDQRNAVLGTTRVLLALREIERLGTPAATRGLDWLAMAQNADGGWGGEASADPAIRQAAEAAINGSGTFPAFSDKSSSTAIGKRTTRTLAAKKSKPQPPPRPPSSSVEETAAAVESLLICGGSAYEPAAQRGLNWLVEAVEANRHTVCSPIGLYFARLWYYERLCPITMTVATLGHALRQQSPAVRPPSELQATDPSPSGRG